MGCCDKSKMRNELSYEAYMARRKCAFCAAVRKVIALMVLVALFYAVFGYSNREAPNGRVEIIIPGEDSPRTDGDGDGAGTHSPAGANSNKELGN